MKLEELLNAYEKVYSGCDKDAIAIVVAVALTRFQTKFDKGIQLCLTGQSSAGKTTLLERLPTLFFDKISTISRNFFLSAYEGRRLGYLINKEECGLVMKDFTDVFSKAMTTQESILADLRGIADGSFSKGTGVTNNIEWKGKMTFITACTPIIYGVEKTFSRSGRRFIFFEMSQPNDDNFFDNIAEDNTEQRIDLNVELDALFLNFFLIHKNWQAPKLISDELGLATKMSKVFTLLRTTSFKATKVSADFTKQQDSHKRTEEYFIYIIKALKYLGYPPEPILRRIVLSGDVNTIKSIYDSMRGGIFTKYQVINAIIKNMNVSQYEANKHLNEAIRFGAVQTSFDSDEQSVQRYVLESEFSQALDWFFYGKTPQPHQ